MADWCVTRQCFYLLTLPLTDGTIQLILYNPPLSSFYICNESTFDNFMHIICNVHTIKDDFGSDSFLFNIFNEESELERYFQAFVLNINGT